MAEAFARQHGGSLVDARSGGSRPLGHVLPEVVVAMRERGIHLSGLACKGFDVAWVRERCDLVVTMGCGEEACPFAGKPMLDWALEDPKGKGLATVRRIRDEVEARVVALLRERGALRNGTTETRRARRTHGGSLLASGLPRRHEGHEGRTKSKGFFVSSFVFFVSSW